MAQGLERKNPRNNDQKQDNETLFVVIAHSLKRSSRIQYMVRLNNGSDL